MGIEAAIIGGSVVSGLMGQDAASDAASASAAGTQAQINEMRRQFDINQANQAPWLSSGTNALNAYNQMLGLPQYNPYTYQSPHVLANPPTEQQDQSSGFSKGMLSELGPSSGPNMNYDDTQGWYVPGGRTSSKPAPGTTPSEAVAVGTDQANPYDQSSYRPPSDNIYNAFSSDNVLPDYNPTEGPARFNQRDRFEFNLEADPGYQFARDEALRAATRQAAAQGNRNSGNLLAELTDRAAGVASQYADQAFRRQLATSDTNYGRGVGEYGMDFERNRDIYNRGVTDYGIQNALADQRYGRELGEYGLGVERNRDIYGRSQNLLNRLAALSGTGQTTAQNLGATGSNTAANIAQAIGQNAANQGNAAIAGATSMGNAINTGINNYLSYDAMQNNPWLGSGGYFSPYGAQTGSYNSFASPF